MSRFERLYRENFPFVWAAAHRCGAPSHAVDDVVQDVFVTAYRRIDELHFEVSPRGWLYGVTRKVAFRYRRSAARHARRRAAYVHAARSSSEPHRDAEASRDLDALLGQVEQAQRETFVMAELLGMSGPEIAAEHCVPLDTVYSRLRLARRRLLRLAGSEARLRAGVAGAYEVQRPTPTQRARTWAAIVPVLGTNALAVPLAAVAAVKSGWLLTLPIAAAALVVVSQLGNAPDASHDDSASTIEASRPSTLAENPRGEVDEAAQRGRDPATVGSEVVTADPSTSAGVAPPVPRSRSRAAQKERDAPDSSSDPLADPTLASSSDLAAELALLDRAGAAVRDGDPSRAIAILAEHARRFPRGQLEEARRATRVQALCDLGDEATARAEGAALRRDHPGSAVAARTEKTCGRS